jgi:thiamine biosynthesis lipoprotein
MKEVWSLMGMTVTVEVTDPTVVTSDLQDIYTYFTYVDQTFSTYKATSEISQINAGTNPKTEWSADMHEVLTLCEQTKQETHGYFNMVRNGKLDPSGVVKGWAIKQAAQLLQDKGFTNFYVDAGGDIQTHGMNHQREAWRVGIRNPFNKHHLRLL